MLCQVLEFKSRMDTLLKFFLNFQGIDSFPPKIFGNVSFVHVHNHLRSKLDPKALSNVFSWGIITHKRDINATILPPKGNTSTWMLPLLKTNLISLKPIFKGKVTRLWKIVDGILVRF